MDDSKPVSTPVNPDVKLVSSESPDDVCDQQMYQAVIGNLLYLSTKTRPDVAYAVSCVVRFCANPLKEHWTAVKRILQYLKGTSNLSLLYRENTPAEVIGYSDADWAGDVGDRSQPLGIYSFWEVLLSAGRAANRLAWPCQLQKQSMLHCLLVPKKLCGFNYSQVIC